MRSDWRKERIKYLPGQHDPERDESLIADTLRTGLEPLGFHVRNNDYRIIVTDISSPEQPTYEVVIRRV